MTPTLGLCAALDPGSDATVEATRAALRAAGVRVPEVPLHRPHLTLAAATVEPDAVPDVLRVAGEVAGRHAAFDLLLDDVGRFDEAGVLWLGPSVRPPALTALQADADAALQAAGWPRAFGEHTDPARWVPHCTLATGVRGAALTAAQDVVRATYRPVRARVTGVAVLQVGARGDVALLVLR